MIQEYDKDESIEASYDAVENRIDNLKESIHHNNDEWIKSRLELNTSNGVENHSEYLNIWDGANNEKTRVYLGPYYSTGKIVDDEFNISPELRDSIVGSSYDLMIDVSVDYSIMKLTGFVVGSITIVSYIEYAGKLFLIGEVNVTDRTKLLDNDLNYTICTTAKRLKKNTVVVESIEAVQVTIKKTEAVSIDYAIDTINKAIDTYNEGLWSCFIDNAIKANESPEVLINIKTIMSSILKNRTRIKDLSLSEFMTIAINTPGIRTNSKYRYIVTDISKA